MATYSAPLNRYAPVPVLARPLCGEVEAVATGLVEIARQEAPTALPGCYRPLIVQVGTRALERAGVIREPEVSEGLVTAVVLSTALQHLLAEAADRHLDTARARARFDYVQNRTGSRSRIVVAAAAATSFIAEGLFYETNRLRGGLGQSLVQKNRWPDSERMYSTTLVRHEEGRQAAVMQAVHAANVLLGVCEAPTFGALQVLPIYTSINVAAA